MLGAEDDDLLQQAIAMSMQVNELAAAPAPPAPSQVPVPQEDVAMFDDAYDDELKMALQMSIEEGPAPELPDASMIEVTTQAVQLQYLDRSSCIQSETFCLNRRMMPFGTVP